MNPDQELKMMSLEASINTYKEGSSTDSIIDRAREFYLFLTTEES